MPPSDFDRAYWPCGLQLSHLLLIVPYSYHSVIKVDNYILSMYYSVMSLREALLGLMCDHPKHGYQLKKDYERMATPLNIGQIYTTLDRLVRNGLVEEAPPLDQEKTVERRHLYRLTKQGHETSMSWFFEPPTRSRSATSDVSEKVLTATRSGAINPLEVVRAQRLFLLEELRVWRNTEDAHALIDKLAAEWKASHIEAELSWLDRAEEALLSEAKK